MRPLRFAAAGLAVALMTSGAAMAQNGPPPPTLVGDAVRSASSGEMAAVVGRFVALRGGPISARVGGAVDDVMVGVGDRVKKGQPLVQLALDRLEAELKRRKALLSISTARIRSAKASLKLAEQSASRLSRLRKSAAFSEALLSDKQREAERAAAQVREAEADRGRAQAELKLAEVDLAYAAVRAPYDGVVTDKHVDVGGFVALGAPVVTMLGDRALEIEAEAPSDRMAGVRPGAIAKIAYGGVSADVPIRAVLPRETGVSRTRTVRFGPLPADLADVAVANAALNLRIPTTGDAPVLSVHKDAVLRRGPNPTVVVAKAMGDGVFQAAIRPVRLGDAIGGRFIVLDGLQAGDVVVVRGNESLRPDQPFKLAPNSG